MKTSKKLIAMLLVMAMLVMTGCGAAKEPAATPSADAVYTAGTYRGVSENGKNGKIVVEVKVSDTAIESVTVVEHAETPGLSDPAIERIPAGVVETQSLAVDAVAGATITCDALLEAIEDARHRLGQISMRLRQLQKQMKRQRRKWLS